MDRETADLMRNVYAEVARLVAIEARVAAMQAENQGREHKGEAPAYAEAAFFDEAKRAEVIAFILKPGGF